MCMVVRKEKLKKLFCLIEKIKKRGKKRLHAFIRKINKKNNFFLSLKYLQQTIKQVMSSSAFY